MEETRIQEEHSVEGQRRTEKSVIE